MEIREWLQLNTILNNNVAEYFAKSGSLEERAKAEEVLARILASLRLKMVSSRESINIRYIYTSEDNTCILIQSPPNNFLTTVYKISPEIRKEIEEREVFEARAMKTTIEKFLKKFSSEIFEIEGMGLSDEELDEFLTNGHGEFEVQITGLPESAQQAKNKNSLDDYFDDESTQDIAEFFEQLAKSADENLSFDIISTHELDDEDFADGFVDDFDSVVFSAEDLYEKDNSDNSDFHDDEDFDEDFDNEDLEDEDFDADLDDELLDENYSDELFDEQYEDEEDESDEFNAPDNLA